MKSPTQPATAARANAAIPGTSLLMNSMLYRDQSLPAVVGVQVIRSPGSTP